MVLPNIVAHADWSTDAAKRWRSFAFFQNGVYALQAPALVGPVNVYFTLLLQLAGDSGRILAGFDFPIGLPVQYAELAGIAEFLPMLPEFGNGLWAAFYNVAETHGQISIQRPFYPRAPGGRLQTHLLVAMGLQSINQLRRQCELPTPTRNAACPLFWTLGSNQVGRAAISGWRDLLAPSLQAHAAQMAIWPFDGHWRQLLSTRRLVVVETYPKDEYAHLQFPANGWSKRDQQHRIARAMQINQWIQQRPQRVVLAPDLAAEINNGFGADADGEDRFDAVVGLLAMLSVVLGDRTDGAPPAPAIQNIEGWIFGQQ
jgi:hypothetical protein